MNTNPDLATVAALIADPSRAAMLSALLGGHALPAGELARIAKISPQTASTHLARLVSGGLLSVSRTGRHRYYHLASKEVANVLEMLALIAPAQRVRSLRHGLDGQAIQQARMCYDHLAGRLGVMLTEALIDHAIIQQCGEAFEVTLQGANWFSEFGIDCAVLERQRRLFAVACVDWSERKPHIAGALGAAVADRLFDLNWIVRQPNTRAVKLTETGYTMFERTFGVKRDALRQNL